MHESCVFRSLPAYNLHCKDAADMAYLLQIRDPFQAAANMMPSTFLTLVLLGLI